MKPACTIDGCDRREHGRGLCGAHWYRWNRYGDPLGGGPARPRAPKECVTEGCDRKPHGHGLCKRHWKADLLANDPEYRERKNTAWREWSAEHSEDRAEYQRRYQEANASQVATRMKKWRAENTPSLLAQGWTRRRRRYGLAEDIVEMVDPAVVFERDGGVCRLCEGSVDSGLKFPDPMAATMDHVIPVRDLESTHSYANVVLAHYDCNRRKRMDRMSVVVPRELRAISEGGK
jgi:hypothetical protein